MAKKSIWRQFGVLSLLVLTLSGNSCDGDDGDDGATGPQGPEGPAGPAGPQGPGPVLDIPSELAGEFTSAMVADDGSVTVTFSLVGDNQAYYGLTTSNVRFTLAKLMPGENNGSSAWQSYINKMEIAPANDTENPGRPGPGTEDTYQATYEREGTLTDNGDGSYSYTFAVNPSAVTEPMEVMYDATLTHRVGMQISGGGFPVVNATHDWVPNGDSLTFTRDMVVEENCNTCHGELAIHGGGRVDTAYCVTCHNPGSVDANSGNTVDFKVMVHKLHMGDMLPSSMNDDPDDDYKIWGFRDGEHDYSHVPFPQDVRNCSKCHNEELEATPDASNWFKVATIDTCSSCHEDVNFETGEGHVGGAQADNENCMVCHGEDSALASIYQSHVGNKMDNQMAAETVELMPVSVASGALSSVNVTISVMKGGMPVASLDEVTPYFNNRGGVYVMINWDDGTGYQMGYSNPGGAFGFTPASNEMPISGCDPVTDMPGYFECNWNGSNNWGAPFDKSMGTLAVTFADANVCVEDGMLSECPLTNPVYPQEMYSAKVGKMYFDLATLAEDTAYVEKFGADFDSCNTCHGGDAIHAGGSNDHAATDFAQCTSCHNSTKPAWYAGRPGDLKSHVHTFHANSDQLHASEDHQVGDTYFPDQIGGTVSNCVQCHADGQYDLVNMQNGGPSHANASGAADGSSSWVSGTAVVCASCHVSLPVGYIDEDGMVKNDADGVPRGTLSGLEQATINHMITNGSVFNGATEADAIGNEACAVCHAVGNEKGVDAVHNIR